MEVVAGSDEKKYGPWTVGRWVQPNGEVQTTKQPVTLETRV
ncbi:hypothetical protein [Ligilactobacillus salivarius]|nr:hypothetical protein [Ligilactobacillus salivarius]